MKHRRRSIFLVVGLAAASVLVAACGPDLAPAPDPAAAWAAEGRVCAQGSRDATTRLGARRTTAVVSCRFSQLPGAGGVYLGMVNGENTAVAFYGPHVGHRDRWYYDTVMTHELGHAWDRNRLTTTQRLKWGRVLGRAWDREAYAETFMLVVTGSPGPGAYGVTAPTPTQRAELCVDVIPCVP